MPENLHLYLIVGIIIVTLGAIWWFEHAEFKNPNKEAMTDTDDYAESVRRLPMYRASEGGHGHGHSHNRPLQPPAPAPQNKGRSPFSLSWLLPFFAMSMVDGGSHTGGPGWYAGGGSGTNYFPRNSCPECGTEYNPVCVTSTGVTYRNKCYAECNGAVPPFREGTCTGAASTPTNPPTPTPRTNRSYTRVSKNCVCLNYVNPVCDKLGRIYKNDCFAKCSPNSEPPFTLGYCATPPPTSTFPPTQTPTPTRTPTPTNKSPTPTPFTEDDIYDEEINDEDTDWANVTPASATTPTLTPTPTLRSSTTPGTFATTLGTRGTTPGSFTTTLGTRGTTPGSFTTTPGTRGTTPGTSNTTLGTRGTTPGTSNTTPSTRGTTPGTRTSFGTTPGTRTSFGTTPGTRTSFGTTPGTRTSFGTTPGTRTSFGTTPGTRTSFGTTPGTRTSFGTTPGTRTSFGTTVRPTTVRPTTVRPTTVRPTTVRPTTVRPTTVRPTTVRPTTVRPTTVRPTTVRPTTARKLTPSLSRTTQNPVVGGTQNAGVSEEARQAANFAVQQLSTKPEFGGKVTLVTISSVRTQVVAGLKYFITMTVNSPKGRQNVDVVVLRKLGKVATFELSSWALKK